jgi:hypothetical protein
LARCAFLILGGLEIWSLPMNDPSRQVPNKSTARLGDDLLRGVKAIADELGEGERRIHHLIATRQIPAFKMGGRLYCRRSALQTHVKKLESQHASGAASSGEA